MTIKMSSHIITDAQIKGNPSYNVKPKNIDFSGFF